MLSQLAFDSADKFLVDFQLIWLPNVGLLTLFLEDHPLKLLGDFFHFFNGFWTAEINIVKNFCHLFVLDHFCKLLEFLLLLEINLKAFLNWVLHELLFIPGEILLQGIKLQTHFSVVVLYLVQVVCRFRIVNS
jgi:hypothetical protein